MPTTNKDGSPTLDQLITRLCAASRRIWNDDMTGHDWLAILAYPDDGALNLSMIETSADSAEPERPEEAQDVLYRLGIDMARDDTHLDTAMLAVTGTVAGWPHLVIVGKSTGQTRAVSYPITGGELGDPVYHDDEYAPGEFLLRAFFLGQRQHAAGQFN